jgi:hypothetical protein
LGRQPTAKSLLTEDALAGHSQPGMTVLDKAALWPSKVTESFRLW